jgi:predicted dehydrogenase
MDTIRWAILGTGGIAAALADTIAAMPDGEVVAVGSRAEETARAFAARHGIARSYGSYEEAAQDPDVGAVYVATTNDLHHDNVLAAVAAGKAVLNEKPFALNAAQTEAMIAAARDAGVFLMEAMWMRFQPCITELKRLISDGVIGDVRWIQADFGFPADPVSRHRLFAPELGGGGLLDLGVYPLTFATSLLGLPTDFRVLDTPAESGVDAQLGIVLQHPGDALSVSSTSLIADLSGEATVGGTAGRIRVHAPFHHSPRLTVHRRGEQVDEIDTSYEGSGYRFEVAEVHRCLREGLTESPVMPLGHSLAMMRLLDDIRAEIGLQFPGE